MLNAVHFFNRLRRFARWRFYMIIAGMLLVGVFEGIGIYMLVPMLQILTDSGAREPSFLAAVFQLPEQWLLILVLSVYVALLLSIALFQRSQSIMAMKVQQGFIRQMRLDIYEGLMMANWEFYLRKRKSDLQHLLTFELARVAQGTTMLLQLVTASLFTLMQITLAFILSYQLTILVIISGLIIAMLSRRYVKKAKVLGEQTSLIGQSYLGVVTDHLGSIKEVKSNMLERSYFESYRDVCNDLQENTIGFVKVRSNTQLLYRASSAILVALFVYMAFTLLHVPLERLIIVILIFARIWPKFTMIQSHVEQIISSLPAIAGVLRLQDECKQNMETKESLTTTADAREAYQLQQGIACKEVYYRYNRDEDRYVLEDINLYIPARTMTALVGKSGSGKSTLIDLIMGLMQPEQGVVEYDGKRLEEHDLSQIRRSIGYVPQEPTLLYASIRDNLLMMNEEASDEEIWEALEFSASHDFVKRLPDGLDTIIGDRGIRLSGGERQRLVLARAILRKPSILILDEATSALDSENEAIIQQAIENLRGRMTIIVIAHRLSTIRHADQVIVLEEGKIVEKGGYKQLSKDGIGIFNRLLKQQSISVQ